MDFDKIDKSYFKVAKLTDPSDEKEFWRSKTPAERMAALEHLRRMAYGYDDPDTSRIQRVFEVVKLKRS
ncbi:hypothetical protein HYR69_03890 [Candidatus Sumerlaeota bacterium]|nr:hypothetical protein [Candidatus Sumerlaeota bacterium]